VLTGSLPAAAVVGSGTAGVLKSAHMVCARQLLCITKPKQWIRGLLKQQLQLTKAKLLGFGSRPLLIEHTAVLTGMYMFDVHTIH
jgi:hypothetical protein